MTKYWSKRADCNPIRRTIIPNVAFAAKSPGRLSDGDQRNCVNLDESVG